MKKILLTGIVLLAGCWFTFAQAQKLNSVQEGSVWAPKVKIDGKLDELNNNFQAYNKSTKLTYTLSNDDKNLYLAVKSTDQQNNTKIMSGGITLTINTADKKKEENAYSIKFPILNRSAMRGGGMRRPRGYTPGAVQDSATLAEAAAMRKQAIASLKEISVLGFKSITDTLISIYNEYGIKAAANYNENADLQVELAIPLSLLNISVDKPKEFAYNIKVNAINFNMGGRGPERNGGGNRNGGGGGGFGGGGGGRNGGGGFGVGGGGFGGGDNPMNELMTDTDFWGKYILIKKTKDFSLGN